MVKIERIKCGNGNCYIVSEGNNAILVDTCREQYKQKILEVCKAYNLRLLVLTHGHVDHVQNASFLAKELHIPIAMCKADVELIKDNMNQPLKATSFLGKIVLAASIQAFKQDKIDDFKPDVFLKEGDTLDEYGIPAKVLSLPGHTKGSIGLEIEKKYLIAGDALMNMFYPTVSMLYNDRTLMLQSAQRISSLGELLIYFGHGKPVKNRCWTK